MDEGREQAQGCFNLIVIAAIVYLFYLVLR